MTSTIQPFEQPILHSPRLTLEPITETHAQELWDLFSDPELHHFVPFEHLSLEKQRERCARWARRRSPDGSELWLNWAAREIASQKVIAHFQAGVKAEGVATIGYVVARAFQRKGFASEGLETLFKYLREILAVKEVKAWSDTRNEASHRLAKKLGMKQVGFIKDADFFKGASSDEFVFSIALNLESVVQASIQYLNSDEAIQSIEANPYWPKWNSPWWHMSVLFEMGLADRIPPKTASKLLSEIKRTHLPYFFREERPSEAQSHHEVPCPCSLGNIYQILFATGLNVDAELPWARNWFLKYQMPDGGLNCDEDAYKAVNKGDSNVSSLVGTIAPLEAILTTQKKLTREEEQFLDRGAKCLLDRELRLGSTSLQNAEERLDEEDWLKPCFPRFYLYDVLRGLIFILKWSDVRNQPIPKDSIAKVIQHLETRHPDGQIRIERHSYEKITTKRGQPASYFPLLDQVSEIGTISPYLMARWIEARELLSRLENRGLLI